MMEWFGVSWLCGTESGVSQGASFVSGRRVSEFDEVKRRHEKWWF